MRGYVVEIIDSTNGSSTAEVNGARYSCFFYCLTRQNRWTNAHN